MEQSPSWEVDKSTASQEIPHIVGYPNVYSRINKHTPPVPTLNQINTVYASQSQFWLLHFIIIFPNTPTPS